MNVKIFNAISFSLILIILISLTSCNDKIDSNSTNHQESEKNGFL